MPGAKDITGDLGKLRKRKVFIEPASAAATPGVVGTTPERRLAFNAIDFFCWTVIGMFMVLQLGFIIWLAQ